MCKSQIKCVSPQGTPKPSWFWYKYCYMELYFIWPISSNGPEGLVGVTSVKTSALGTVGGCFEHLE